MFPEVGPSAVRKLLGTALLEVFGYYAKQLAQEVVRKATDVPLLANDIEVL